MASKPTPKVSMKGKKNLKSPSKRISPIAEITRAKSTNGDPYCFTSVMDTSANSLDHGVNEVSVSITDFFDYSNEVPSSGDVVNSVYGWWLDLRQNFLNTGAGPTTNSYQNGIRVLSAKLYALPLVAIGQSIADSTYVVKTVFPASLLENSAQIVGLESGIKVMNPNFTQNNFILCADYKVDTLLKSGLLRPYVKSPADMCMLQIQCVNPDTDLPITGRNIQFKLVVKVAVVMSPSQQVKFAIKEEDDFATAGDVTTVEGRVYCQFNGMTNRF